MKKRKTKKADRTKRTRKVFTYQGQKFASSAERDFAIYLDEHKIPWQYEPEKFDWEPPVKKYTPDFALMKKSGNKMYLEMKGYFRNEDRTKIKCFVHQYPEIDFRMVFLDASKPIYKSSPSSYGDWCDKLKIPWAENRIPENWMEELECIGKK